MSTQDTSPRTPYRSRRLFFKSHLSLILSRLLSKSQPLMLGCDLVLGADLKTSASIVLRCSSGKLPHPSRTPHLVGCVFFNACAEAGIFLSTLPTPEQSSLCSGIFIPLPGCRDGPVGMRPHVLTNVGYPRAFKYDILLRRRLIKRS